MKSQKWANWPALWGLRSAWALAFVELGIAGFDTFEAIQEPALRALFFLGPLGAYGFGGLLLDLSLARLAPRIPLLRFLPLAIFALISTQSFRFTLATMDGPLRWSLFAIGLALAFLILRYDFSASPKRQQMTKRLAWVVVLAGCGGSLLYLAIPRQTEFREPIASRPEGPNVVVITWDTIRADVLPIYGGKGLTTPVLDAFAAKSTLFEDMSAVAPITAPSHASIFTGVVPPTHAIRSNGPFNLSANVTTMAEHFSKNGYATGGFVSAYPVRGEVGFARGFDVFDDRLPIDRLNRLISIGLPSFFWLRPLSLGRRFAEEPSVEGDTILKRTGNFLSKVKGPYMMWAHFFDAHGQHNPAPEYKQKAMAAKDQAWPLPVQPEACGERMTLYRGEIMELDWMLEELLAQVETTDPGLDNTIIFLLSDHGQCFGEAGFLSTHTPSLTEATQHIPGILYIPGEQARRSNFPTNQIDVFPTLAAAAGLSAPEGVQGVDLTPIAMGQSDTIQRALFRDGFYMEAFQFYLMGGAAQDLLTVIGQKRKPTSEGPVKNRSWTSREDLRKQALRGQGWKYLKVFNGDEFLYDLTTIDANGQRDATDLRESRPQIFQDRKSRFLTLWDLIPKNEQISGESSSLDNTMLEELGYLGDGAH